MSYRHRQLVLSGAFLASAIAAAMASGSLAGLAAVPFTSLLIGWPLATFVFIPEQRRFVSTERGRAPVPRRTSLVLLLSAVFGVTILPSLLRLFGDAFMWAAVAQLVAAIGGAFFFMSRTETR